MANPNTICCVGGRAGTIFCGMKTRFTEKQGQYLAFIYYYTKVNGRPPAEADMQRYFRVTPPSVHQMILTIEANVFSGASLQGPSLGDRSLRLNRVPSPESNSRLAEREEFNSSAIHRLCKF